MIPDIARSPAASVLNHADTALTLGAALIPLAIVAGYHTWVRKHMWRKAIHWIDLFSIVLCLDSGVALASLWPGQWIHSLFGTVAAWWDSSPQRTGGSEWTTIAAILLAAFLLGAIVRIWNRQHQGPVTTVLALAVLLPLVLVATQGSFGQHAMQVVNALAHPSTFARW